ncbi:polyhydroxyalkanoate depolymerase, partial [Burkholderia pseudomallei]|nr:polyhydroxyalkanoate depolymerase [Burkholderia pseudomallei]
ISGSGQTHVAHELCTGIPQAHRRSLTAEKCGHYGIFSGRRWRTIIYPQLRDFIREHASQPKKPAPQAGPTPTSPSTPRQSTSGRETASAAPAKAAALRLTSAKRPAAKTRAAKPAAAKRPATKVASARARKVA